MRITSAENDRIWRRSFIRRTALTGVLMTLVLIGLLGSGRISATIAQEGTPEGEMTTEGVVFEPLAAGSVHTLPSVPALFQITRLRIEPGGHLSVPSDGPGLALIYVESGTMICSATTLTSVMRASLPATPEAQPFEEVAAGTEFTVGPGDSFVGLPNAGGEFRNDGTEEVVLLVADLHPETAGAPAP